MELIEQKLGNGNTITYKIIDGTAFHYKIVLEDGTVEEYETPDEVCRILNSYRGNRKRLKIYLGDRKTGKDWNEEFDTVGTISRSTGSIKIPLLIKTSRSLGGGAILDHCILKIRDLESGLVLYQQANYQAPKVDIVPSDLPEYQFNTIVNGQIHGRHKSKRSADICANKIR